MNAPTPAPAKPKITDEIRKAADLKLDPKNARRHSEQQIAQIVSSIEEYGYVNKIAVRPDNVIIGGHATFEALKRIGRDTIEVRVVGGLSPVQYKRLALALNKLPENSSWDETILAQVLGELAGSGDPLENIGFSDKERAELLAPDDPIEVKTIETGPVADEFWISIRGPLAQQAAALRAMQAAMKPFAGVSVDLGTIAMES